MTVLETYPWPGNIRELENLIERMVVLGSDGRLIEEKDLHFDLLFHEELMGEAKRSTIGDMGLIKARRAFERRYILLFLQKCDWNQTEVAHRLKIHRNTLINKMKELNLKMK